METKNTELSSSALHSLVANIASNLGRVPTEIMGQKGTIHAVSHGGDIRFFFEGPYSDSCLISFSYAGKPFSKHSKAASHTLEAACLKLALR